ncbi:MAG: KamA family radical SAM protein [Candidatus Latescibacterota bacterium]
MTRTHHSSFTVEVFREEAKELLQSVTGIRTLQNVRKVLFLEVSRRQFDTLVGESEFKSHEVIVSRDCARALRLMFSERSDSLAGFSVPQAIWDIARGIPRPDLGPGFYAEMIHLVRGVEGNAERNILEDIQVSGPLSGRDAALARSDSLDRIWEYVAKATARFADGLSGEAREQRKTRREHILTRLGGSAENWRDWRWQMGHIIRDPETLAGLVTLGEDEFESVRAAVKAELPFGVTPYYLSLMDNHPGGGRDSAVRAQVLPPADYVAEMKKHGEHRAGYFDFMREGDTSPVDLITRRYPSIVILKPFNTCPQICVYCQRNWEIKEPMAPGALAGDEQIDAACRWIGEHPSITEVLVTGGDPLAMSDERVRRILGRIARIRSINMIRIGTRIPVTMPMRITDDLADILGNLRRPGELEVCVVTHVEHPYEVTPEFVEAINRLRMRGMSVYNQLVYTFFVSRRFEASRLRMLLRTCGVDPYYTFAPKGKEETRAYRVPLARLLQEQKEEARLLPGTRRTDEVVYNVPGLGKNYLRAVQHRDLISILPDGARVYEFHPWEKNVVSRDTYVGTDVPIFEYLTRLEESGENPEDYGSIWYYF